MRSTQRTTAAAVLLAILALPPAVSGTTVQFPDIEATSVPGETTTGSVMLAVTNATPMDLGGYTIVLDIEPRSGASDEVFFTGSAHAPDELITSVTGPIFSDTGEFVFITDLTDAGTVPLVGGNLFSLEYSVAPDTHGVFDVKFLFSPLASELQNGIGDPIPTTFIGGTMTVSVIPEPGATGMMAAGMVVCLCSRWYCGYRRGNRLHFSQGEAK